MHRGLGLLWSIEGSLQSACLAWISAILLLFVSVLAWGIWVSAKKIDGSWRGLGGSFFPWGHRINWVSCACISTVTHHMRLGIEFFTCGIMSVLKTFQILDHFRFQIFGLELLNLFTVSLSSTLVFFPVHTPNSLLSCHFLKPDISKVSSVPTGTNLEGNSLPWFTSTW